VKPLHSRVQSTVSRVAWTRITESKAWKDATVSCQSYDISILGLPWYYIHRLPRKGPDQQRVWYDVIGAVETKKSRKNLPFEENKSAVSSRSIKTTAKLDKLGYKLLSHPPYSPDLAPSDFFCLQTLKECLLERNLALMKR
jgi:hypothetical protein